MVLQGRGRVLPRRVELRRRWRGALVAAGLVASLATSLDHSRVIAAQDRPPTADALLAAARQALGGEQRLTTVKTVVITGRTRQVRGDNLVPIEFEIDIELPDKYLRRDEFPAQDSGPVTTGFNGDAVLQSSATPGSSGPPPGAAAPPPEQLEAQRAAQVATLKQDAARLMLGLLAGTAVGPPPTGVGGVFVQGGPGGAAPTVTTFTPPPARVRMFFFANIQNVLDRPNYGGYSGTLTSPFFGQPTLVINPRKVDFGIGFQF